MHSVAGAHGFATLKFKARKELLCIGAGYYAGVLHWQLAVPYTYMYMLRMVHGAPLVSGIDCSVSSLDSLILDPVGYTA